MYAVSADVDRLRLRQRREEVNRTARYVRAETLSLERNAASMDPAAFQRRMRLLKDLADWYEHEGNEIDDMLANTKDDCGSRSYVSDTSSTF